MDSVVKKIIAIACPIIIVLLVIFFMLTQRSEPSAIRPFTVTDPILNPVIQAFADDVDSNPSAPKPRMELGMTYEGAGMNELAERTYKQYAEMFPERIIGWYRLAIVQNKQGKSKQAMESLSRGAEVAPEQMDAPHWQLALWYIDNGRLTEAKEQVAIADMKRSNSMQVLIAKGRIALEENNPELAIDILNNNLLISAVPDGYVYQLLGRAYRANGEEEKSREAWSRAGQNKPNWADPWTQLVVSHVVGLNAKRQDIMKQMRAGNIDMARVLIDEYFTYDKDSPVVRRLDASCDARQGNIGPALKKFVDLIKEDRTDIVSMVLLAKLRMRIPALQTPEETLITREILMSVLELAPDHEQAKTLVGTLPQE